MSPDWDSVPVAIPYAVRTNPQSFNLYGYVGNNPLSRTDPDGHCTNGGQRKGFFWCLFNDSDQDAAQARQNLALYKNISINGKTPADAARGLSNTQTVQLERSVFNYISSKAMSSPGMMMGLALVPGAAEELIPAEAAAASEAAGVAVQATGDLAKTPGGRVLSAHYLNETGPIRNIPGSVVDETIDHATSVQKLEDRTVYYDSKNDVTVVQSDTTGKIMSARKGQP